MAVVISDFENRAVVIEKCRAEVHDVAVRGSADFHLDFCEVGQGCAGVSCQFAVRGKLRTPVIKPCAGAQPAAFEAVQRGAVEMMDQFFHFRRVPALRIKADGKFRGGIWFSEQEERPGIRQVGEKMKFLGDAGIGLKTADLIVKQGPIFFPVCDTESEAGGFCEAEALAAQHECRGSEMWELVEDFNHGALEAVGAGARCGGLGFPQA